LLLVGCGSPGGSTSLGAAGSPPAAKVAEAPVPRTILFADGQRQGAQLSPDGTRLAWKARVDGRVELVVGELATLPNFSPVTQGSERSPDSVSWSSGGRFLLFGADRAGDERWQLFATELSGGANVALTPGQGERATVVRVAADRALIASNERDPAFADLWEVDLETGGRRMVYENVHGYTGFAADAALRPRLAEWTDPTTGELRLDALEPAVDPRAILSVEFDSLRSFRILEISDDGERAWVLHADGRDTAALVELDLETGAGRVLLEDERCDLSAALFLPGPTRPLLALAEFTHHRWLSVSDEAAALAAAIEGLGPARVELAGVSSDGSRVALRVSGPRPPRVVVLDVATGREVGCLEESPDLAERGWSTKHAVLVSTRDGHEMVAYLTLPQGSDSDDDGVPDSPLPCVLMLHGGPWDRVGAGFDPWQQWLVDRGYGVVAPNFRGSTGFGNAWMSAGDREWGGAIQDDAIDTIRWLVERDIADPERVGAWGASFGGYLALRLAASSPEHVACAFSTAGPTNLVTLYESLPEYWTAFRAEYRRRVGDATHPAGRAQLEAHSPLHQADAFRRPLLIASAANDSRVPLAEAERLVEALRGNAVPVTQLVLEDSGHGTSGADAQTRAYLAIGEAFFARWLGGRHEPLGDSLEGAGVGVPHGAEQVPGLPEALSRHSPTATAGE
jgi:dipeptidyl aminopeptidase/acylaminoacyl peptidase